MASPITSRPYGDCGAGEDRLVASAYRTAGDGFVYDEGDKTAPLTTSTDPNANIITTSTGNRAHCLNAGGMGRQDYETETMVVGALQSGGTTKGHGTAGINNQAVAAGHVIPVRARGPISGVRRLTVRECERLQGFPDDWTLVPHRNKPAADGPRYKAIGNSMAVPVMKWIGERIELSEKGAL